jgi:hypothetical protein
VWMLSEDNISAVCVATLAGHSDRVNSVAFDPTGRFVATSSDDKTAKIWRLSPDGAVCIATCVATLAGHSGRVTSVAFHPTGQFLATTSQDQTAKVWRLSPSGAATCIATLTHPNEVSSVAFHPKGRLLATTDFEGTAILWEMIDTLPAPAPAPPRPIPSGFICPISEAIMEDPVACADGHSYDRANIMMWFAAGHNTSPNTGAVLPHLNVVPNHALRNAIEDFLRFNGNGGRMSRRKNKRSNRKYKKGALRRSRK